MRFSPALAPAMLALAHLFSACDSTPDAPDAATDAGLDAAPRTDAASDAGTCTIPLYIDDMGEPEPDLDAEAVGATFRDGLIGLNVPGGIVVRVRDGELALVVAAGFRDPDACLPVTPDTLFETAQTARLAAGLAAIRAGEDGVLSLDEPLSPLVPELTIDAGADDPVVSFPTIRDAFGSATGLMPRPEAEPSCAATTLATWIEAGSPVQAWIEPGVWPIEYPDDILGDALVARALELRAGRGGESYRDVIGRLALHPAGATHAVWTRDEAIASGDWARGYVASGPFGADEALGVRCEGHRPSDGLWVSGRELAAVLAVVLRRGVALDGTRVVMDSSPIETPQASLRSAQYVERAPTLGAELFPTMEGDNVTVYVADDVTTGVQTTMTWRAGEDDGWIAIFNIAGRAGPILDGVRRALSGTSPWVEETPALPPEEWDLYVGHYTTPFTGHSDELDADAPSAVEVVRIDATHLGLIVAPATEPLPLVSRAWAHTFGVSFAGSELELSFALAADGTVAALTWQSASARAFPWLRRAP